MKYYNTFILEDSFFELSALIKILETMAHIQIVGNAKTISDAIAECERLKPDLIIVDAKIGYDKAAGEKFTRYIRRQLPNVRLLGLTYHVDLLDGLKRAGCDYVAHKALLETPENAKKFIQEALTPRPVRFRDYTPPTLTDVQDRVLRLICAGYTEHEIETELQYPSRKSVKNVKKALFDAFGARSAPNLVHLAYKTGYLDPDTEE